MKNKSIDTLSNIADNMAERYVNDPYIRFLAQAIPGLGSAVDSALVAQINKMREKRIYVFFDELSKRKISLSEEDKKKDGFLHSYFCTVKYVLNTRREEKIKLFAKLFNNYVEKKHFDVNKSDEYEEMLNILDDMSYKEFQVLIILSDFEKENPKDNTKSDLEMADKFWDNFIDKVYRELEIPKKEIPGVLTRLNRTGLYRTITGAYLDYSGDKGNLTPNFYKFIDSIGTNK
ncbi:hypothetical protein [Clostridium hydrogenum]|uniref:hypothetical protein n=1 Tax=Clostridium hydrogenum TaxID=2855764 RepID=UPI001F3EFED6|nr:hypothetical protein [Clostridium hydrogenum]